MSVQQLFDLTGRVAIVTGGSVGLGYQIARGLAEAGANVVLAARKVKRCEDAAEQIRTDFGVKALAVACNVSEPDSVAGLISATLDEFGKIDILVNNAGVAWAEPAEDHSLNGWNRVIGVNLNGTFFCCQQAGKVMIKQGYGKIINISSVCGFVGSDPEAVDTVSYTATKGAVNLLTKDLAAKWARHNINVNAIAPGYFPTDLNVTRLDEVGDILINHIPMRRYGQEGELTGAVLYLASDASSYVTGHVLVVDGGYLSV